MFYFSWSRIAAQQIIYVCLNITLEYNYYSRRCVYNSDVSRIKNCQRLRLDIFNKEVFNRIRAYDMARFWFIVYVCPVSYHQNMHIQEDTHISKQMDGFQYDIRVLIFKYRCNIVYLKLQITYILRRHFEVMIWPVAPQRNKPTGL